jgi:uncharacterized phage protein (TIGR01671 family)
MNFRIWDKTEKRMINEPATEKIFLSGNGNLIDMNHTDGYLMEDHIVMFSTGIVDKNIKDIFEGDIVLVKTWLGRIKNIYFVCFEDGAFQLKSKGETQDITQCLVSNFDDIEVLGNIYENPELLEAKHG